jgi:hypothetical protein
MTGCVLCTRLAPDLSRDLREPSVRLPTCEVATRQSDRLKSLLSYLVL